MLFSTENKLIRVHAFEKGNEGKRKLYFRLHDFYSIYFIYFIYYIFYIYIFYIFLSEIITLPQILIMGVFIP